MKQKNTRCPKCNTAITPSNHVNMYDKSARITLYVCLDCYQIINTARTQTRIQALAKNNYIGTHRIRAKKLGLPITLTLEQWNQTKTYFNQKCAYCQSSPIECLEHFVPLEWGQGTTQYNCVPSCKVCNLRKKGYHPALVKHIPQEDIERVRDYLLTRLEIDLKPLDNS